MWRKIKAHVDALYVQAEADERAGKQRSVALYARLFIGLVRQLIADDALTAASALAYTTVVSMVPLLAVVFAVLNGLIESVEVANSARAWLLNTFLADSVGDVTRFIDDFLSRAHTSNVGTVGFIFLLFTSVSLFLSIETSFNRIWRVPASRPLVRRLTTFYSVITVSPALLALAFAGTRWVQAGLGEWPLLFSLVGTVLPWLLEAAALCLMYKLLPHTPIRWRSALIGGVGAAVAFELSKWGFNSYVRTIYSGSVSSKIYGSFALVPVFFLWIYLVWLIILFGVELAYMVQNHRQITGRMMARRGRSLGHPAPPNGYLCSRVMFEVAVHFQAQGGGINPIEVAAALQIPLDEVRGALAPLVKGGLILVVEDEEVERLVPARPLERIRLADVYALTEGDGYRPGELPETPSVRALEDALKLARDTGAAALTQDLASIIHTPD